VVLEAQLPSSSWTAPPVTAGWSVQHGSVKMDAVADFALAVTELARSVECEGQPGGIGCWWQPVPADWDPGMQVAEGKGLQH